MLSSKQHRFLIASVLIILFCVVQYEIWASPQGLQKYFYLSANLEQQAASNASLQASNQIFEKEVVALKHSRDALEHQARFKLNYIKAGERYYRYI